MSLRDHLLTIRKQWWVIILLMALCGGGALALSKAATPLYSSTSSVYFSLPTGNSGADLSSGSTYTQSQMLSYAELATQPIVLDPVVADLDLPLTARQLSHQVSAKANKDTVILALTARSASPAQAQRIADTVAVRLSDAVAQLSPRDATGKSTTEANIVAKAQLPTFPTSPNTRRNVVAALLAGLALGVATVLARARIDTRVRSTADLPNVDTPLLGEIGQSNLRSPDIAVRDHSRGAMAEGYRRVSTNLGFLGIDGGPLVITITSSLPGEGKSTTSINLALALAEAGKRVLLIEADLRRPSFANYLGLVGVTGLTTVLMGEATVEDLAQPIGKDGLDVLTAGEVPPNPTVLLGSQAMHKLIEEAKARYDVVLLDTAPLLPVADAAVLAPLTTGAVLIARCNVVHRHQLDAAMRSLEQVDAPVLGVVLNGVKGRTNSPYYEYRSNPTPPVWRRWGRSPGTSSEPDNGTTTPLPATRPVSVGGPSKQATPQPAGKVASMGDRPASSQPVASQRPKLAGKRKGQVRRSINPAEGR